MSNTLLSVNQPPLCNRHDIIYLNIHLNKKVVDPPQANRWILDGIDRPSAIGDSGAGVAVAEECGPAVNQGGCRTAASQGPHRALTTRTSSSIGSPDHPVSWLTVRNRGEYVLWSRTRNAAFFSEFSLVAAGQHLYCGSVPSLESCSGADPHNGSPSR